MNQCVANIKGIDPNITDREAAELLRELNKRARDIQRRNAGLSATDAMEAAGAEFKRNAEMVATAKKRNEYLGRLRRLQAVDTIRTKFAGDYERGLKSLLVGTQGGEGASRLSAGLEVDALQKWYAGGLIADLSRVDGGQKIVAKGLLGREVANVLFALNKPGAKLDGMDPRAIALGKAIHKWQEVARTYANKAGAWIGKLDGYIVTQTHDMMRVANDKDGWMAMMRERADLDRMMAETDADSVDDLLNSLYNGLSTGVHLKKMPGNGAPPSKGLRGMARGLSQDRVIHFKSADDWFEYNEKFGTGSIYDSAFNGLHNTARATGLMRVLGPNHEATYDGIVQDLVAELQRRGDPKSATLVNEAKRMKEWYLAQVDGSLNIPANNMVTKFLQGARVVQTMSSLGASLFASVGDTGVMAVGAKYNGANALSIIGNGLKNFVRLAKTQDELDALADMGLAMETLATTMISDRYGIDGDVTGMLARWQQLFFTANFQNRWTDAQRSAIAMGLSSNLARRAGTEFAALPKLFQTTLGQYGIDAGMWNLLRKGTLREVEGQKLLTPSAIEGIPDEGLARYLADAGQPAKPGDVKALRFEMERKFRNYLVDQNGYMLLTPDAATMGAMKAGTRADTLVGQLVRTVMQFKSFSVAFSQRVLTREYKQNGLMGVANMLVLTTMAGYAAMTLKDAAKGKKARDPMDGGTWLAAMTQGGGLGIYGDLLSSQVFDRKQEAGVALLGPTASDVLGQQGLLGLAGRAASGEDPSAAGVRFVQSNTPFLNLFYTKPILDYLVFYNLQEAVNPGSLQRMEREMKDRTGQEMYYPPSQYRVQPEMMQ